MICLFAFDFDKEAETLKLFVGISFPVGSVNSDQLLFFNKKMLCFCAIGLASRTEYFKTVTVSFFELEIHNFVAIAFDLDVEGAGLVQDQIHFLTEVRCAYCTDEFNRIFFAKAKCFEGARAAKVK